MNQRSKPTKHKIVVAMSGGVDSSVAAALLKQDGHEVIGCFMRLGHDEFNSATSDNQDDPKLTGQCVTTHRNNRQGCCSTNDAADARQVAATLDIPFYVLNFKDEFDRIIEYFIKEYDSGRTPNPCIRCNQWLKFGRLLHYAQAVDADYVATGHYARIDHGHFDGNRLLRGIDRQKDQSYVLFASKRRLLDRLMLPIGELAKTEVRRIARELNLPVSDKPDSQEICFVPNNNYAEFVQKRTGDSFKEGTIVDLSGRVLGTHGGHQRFTIGQRRGLGIAMPYPLYVLDKNTQQNSITVGPKNDLLTDRATADQANWLIDPPDDQEFNCQVKIRYNSEPTPACVRAITPNRIEVRFDKPIYAVTPGQAMVCYDDDRVLGGGWICDRTLRNTAKCVDSDPLQ